MKRDRRARLLAVLKGMGWPLGGGVLITVLVSWACAWLPAPSLTFYVPAYAASDWPGPTPRHWLTPSELCATHDIPYAVQSHSRSFGQSDYVVRCGHPVDHVFWVRSMGLPFRAMRFDYLAEHTMLATGTVASSFPVVSLWRQGFGLSSDAASPGLRIPFNPVWPGFLLNTLIYAVVLFAGVRTAPWVVARRRRAKGACPECGYELGALARCPECGRADPLPGAES